MVGSNLPFARTPDMLKEVLPVGELAESREARDPLTSPIELNSREAPKKMPFHAPFLSAVKDDRSAIQYSESVCRL
jgi:hypothetical protein